MSLFKENRIVTVTSHFDFLRAEMFESFVLTYFMEYRLIAGTAIRSFAHLNMFPSILFSLLIVVLCGNLLSLT